LKIQVYGAIGNPGSRWFDERVAQSVTLSGRQIVKHMISKINEIIAGEYIHDGISCVYGDSVTGDSLIKTDSGIIPISQLFDECAEKCIIGEKHYGVWSDAKVIGFDAYEMEPVLSDITCVMKHKTNKKLYKITTENGKEVTVTEDHSIMVDRDGMLMQVKPTEIEDNDKIITLI
jgi:DNA polymerase elongation subunit (family B)